MQLNQIYQGDCNELIKKLYDSNFNRNISKWDVSNVETMSYIFDKSPLKKKPEYQPKFEQ